MSAPHSPHNRCAQGDPSGPFAPSAPLSICETFWLLIWALIKLHPVLEAQVSSSLFGPLIGCRSSKGGPDLGRSLALVPGEREGARSEPKGALRCFGTELGRKFPAPPALVSAFLSSSSPDCAAGSLLLAAERPSFGMHSARLDAFVSHLRAEVVNSQGEERGKKIRDAVGRSGVHGGACMRTTESGV